MIRHFQSIKTDKKTWNLVQIFNSNLLIYYLLITKYKLLKYVKKNFWLIDVIIVK